MRQHKGMRPQDIVVLLKIVLWENKEWQFKDLAKALYISPAEVSESLYRSSLAGLVNHQRKRVFRKNFIEFLQFGLPYVFPQAPGAMTKGLATAHSHPYFNENIISEDVYVWPDLNGKVYGQAIEPLYANQVSAVKEDKKLYEVLSMLEVIRVGKNREKRIAFDYLESLLVSGI